MTDTDKTSDTPVKVEPQQAAPEAKDPSVFPPHGHLRLLGVG